MKLTDRIDKLEKDLMHCKYILYGVLVLQVPNVEDGLQLVASAWRALF